MELGLGTSDCVRCWLRRSDVGFEVLMKFVVDDY